MTMNYLQKSKRRQSVPWFGVFTALTVLFLIIALVFPQVFGTIIHALSRPLWNAGTYISTTSLGSYFVSKKALYEENLELKKQHEELIAQTSIINLLEAENKELKSNWKRGNTLEESNTIVGSVIVTPPRSPYDTMVIYIGSNHGVKVGALVTAYSKVVLGIVREVYAHSSIVELFSSPESQYEVIIGNGIRAQALGKGGGVYEATLPRGIEINLGDSVYVPSITPRIYGTVDSIIEDDAQPFVKLLFKTPINIEKLTFVEVDLEPTAFLHEWDTIESLLKVSSSTRK